MTVNVQKRRHYRVARISRRPAVRRDISPGRRLYMLLTALTAAGVFAGAYAFSAYGGQSAAELAAHHGGGFIKCFADSLLLTAVYVGICFFGGFSSAGKPMAYLLCIFKGMGAGFLSACIFSGGISAADPKTAADILPFEAMSIAVIIFAARENIRLSDLTSKRTFGSAAEGQVDLKLYLTKFAVIMITAAGAAAIDGLLSM